MTASETVPPRAVVATPIDFGDRAAILGLAARRREAATLDDDALLRDAHGAGAEPETRLRAWASGRGEWPAVRSAVDTVSRRARLATGAALLITASLGWFAGSAALSTPRDEPVNVVWLVQGILLGQSVLLALWLALQTLGSSAAWASIGGAAATAFGAITRSVARRDGAIASASTSLIALHQDRSLSRWTLGAVTHSLWLAFNVGCLLAVALRLTFHRYSFCWESTWLPDGWFAWLCSVFAAGPSLLGIPTPDAAMVAASERGAIAVDVTQPREVRQAWTGFLLGAIVIYGVLPRGVLALACVALRARALRGVRLYPSSVVLDPLLRSIDDAVVASAPRAAWPETRHHSLHASQRGGSTPASPPTFGAPAIAAIEMAIPASGWPPAPARAAEDLGVVASGDDRRAALTRLASLSPPPSRLVLAVSLASPPDRGVQAAVEEFVSAVNGRVRLVLSGGDVARRRLDPGGVARRIEGWRALADRAGIPEHAIEEIDLDLLTASSSARLRATVESTEPRGVSREGDDSSRASGKSVLAQACEIISRRCAADEPPDPATLLRTQAEILALYHVEDADEREGRRPGRGDDGLKAELRQGVDTHAATVAALFREHASPASVGTAASRITGGATRMLALLPPALAGSARWSTAGAIAGGLGCLALAGVAGPALGATAVVGILSGLPGWIGVGAGGGALAQLGRALAGTRRAPSSPGAEAPGHARTSAANDERVTAIAVAALWMATLEFQGEGESTIGAALGAAFPTPDPALERMESALGAIDGSVDGSISAIRSEGVGRHHDRAVPVEARRRAAIDEWLRTVQARLVTARDDAGVVRGSARDGGSADHPRHPRGHAPEQSERSR